MSVMEEPYIVWLVFLGGALLLNWALGKLSLPRWVYGVLAAVAGIGGILVTHYLQPWHQSQPWHQPLWVALVGITGGQLAFARARRRSAAA